MASVTSERDIPLPPLEMMREIGSPTVSSFEEIGPGFLSSFQERARLRPDARVLEVGCGCGRIARTLTKFLSPVGSYAGIDIMLHHIQWCAAEITTRFPNFCFFHADIYSSRYNPTGQLRASDYSFPFDSGLFDFVFLASVFTHMLPGDVDRYMAEISRVLRPGGRVLATYYLLNKETRAAIVANSTTAPAVAFIPRREQRAYWTNNPSTPEVAVALDEKLVTRFYRKHALRIDRIYPGNWTPRPGTSTGQDAVLATRESIHSSGGLLSRLANVTRR